MDFTDFVLLAGVIKDTLGRSRLAGINVGHDADVAIVFERGVAGHVYVSESRSSKSNKKAGGPGIPFGTGIHPPPPGAAAIDAQLGTRGAPASAGDWFFFSAAFNYSSDRSQVNRREIAKSALPRRLADSCTHAEMSLLSRLMSPVVLVTDQPLMLARRRMEDDPELAPGSAIVGTYLGDALLTRSIAEPDWEPESDQGLLDTPRRLHYKATEIDGGTIRAELGALIDASDAPREPWQPEPEADAAPLILPLGVVVRIAADRTGAALELECFVHFQAILSGSAEPVADRILRRL
ncbi:MAG: hypothetical protein M3R65_12125 [Gemmatimonadota bacterium]|nr:hypothetical protein [Gemmatimonadota bacterium]